MRITIAYLLIFLSLWSQFDDVLLPPSLVLPSASLPDDDDEYVSTRPDSAWERSSIRQKPAFVRMQSKTADFISMSPRQDSSESNRAGLIGPSPLYVFMSLQL